MRFFGKNKSFTDLVTVNNIVNAEVLCVADINQTTADGCDIAKSEGLQFRFSFNGINLVCNPDDSPVEIATQYSIESDKRRSAYQNSLQGINERTEMNAKINKAQTVIDSIMPQLTDAIYDGNKVLIKWIKQYIENTQYCGLNIYINEVLNTFRQAGHVAKQSMGLPQNLYKRDKNIALRYIVGQVMDCLERGMPPHPVGITFCEEYLKMS